MGPSLEIRTNKQKGKSRKRENERCGMEESRGKFPPFLINSVNENQEREKERRKEKEERRRRKMKEKEEEKRRNEKENFPDVLTVETQRSEN